MPGQQKNTADREVVQVQTIDTVFSEFSVVGTLVGNYSELSVLMTLTAQREMGQTHHS